MQAIELVKMSFDMGNAYSARLLDDLADQPLRRMSIDAGPHALWLLGHLVVAEVAVLDQYLLGRPHRFASWCTLFATGTSPVGGADARPDFDELKGALSSVRSELKGYIDGLSDADLDKPCYENDWPGPKHESVGACLMAMCMHMAIHAGQAASLRSAFGRAPMFG